MVPQPHIMLDVGQVREVCITVGDPARALKMAEMCEQHKELAYNREYRSFDVKHKGKAFTIISHGVGASGACICFEELIKCGAKVIMRAGTCGSLMPDKYGQGDLIICTGGVRDEGTSERMIPMSYPAVADAENVLLLEQVIKEQGAKYAKGLMLSSDVFYPVIAPTNYEMWAKANVIGIEMEVSALFVLCQIRGCAGVGLCTIDGSPLKWDSGDYDPHGTKVAEGKKRMLEAAIEWASRASKQT
ncbi:unnamed protein product [Vitrella brassicaformis CCMP3155]|uniref:Nucleoside phosphorylase domain-containing protein n=2 Tax=Vitrella brassicaformis TaxID=1169539 RepID=A0A0G4EKR8_VITBC|nr:unnamed protein product [Vitrella brassicaformis CCMP3155]|eukprot:CEL97122.1 unnamed protein product [Vitrella brassicaformis CCMP3155]